MTWTLTPLLRVTLEDGEKILVPASRYPCLDALKSALETNL
jgi:hypothetical protein